MRHKLAAEFFGTFWLVFGGCGAAVLAATYPTLGIGFAGVALAFGLTVMTMAYAVGGISGGADTYAKIRAGASAVQLYTALVFHGPGLVGRILRDLAACLRADGFAAVADAVGTG